MLSLGHNKGKEPFIGGRGGGLILVGRFGNTASWLISEQILLTVLSFYFLQIELYRSGNLASHSPLADCLTAIDLAFNTKATPSGGRASLEILGYRSSSLYSGFAASFLKYGQFLIRSLWSQNSAMTCRVLRPYLMQRRKLMLLASSK